MRNNLSQCHNCGGNFPDEYMADCIICRGCMQIEMKNNCGEPVFIDSLGIVWTQSELEEAGGLAEVQKMAHEADGRNH
jgi:hypothetical protein